MLVTFHTKAYANITMFGDVAKQLLELLGHSGTIPSAIKAEDVPAALARRRSVSHPRAKLDGHAPVRTQSASEGCATVGVSSAGRTPRRPCR